MKRDIRQTIQDYMDTHNMNIYSLAKLTGINRGILSGTFNKNPPNVFSIKQLDKLTEKIGLPEGFFYTEYVYECTQEIHWRRVQPFLIRCAELNRLDCLSLILPLLSEQDNHATWIFTTAEELYESNFHNAADLLYRCITEMERSNFSERLAISYYRIFKIHFNDRQKGYDSAVQFMPYRQRMPEAYVLDGLLMLTEINFVRKQWEEVEKYSDELHTLAKKAYDSGMWKSSSFELQRPLVYYYAQGYLFKASSYEHREDYKEFKKWIKEYQDLSWFEGLDEEGLIEVERFKLFAKGNLLLCELKSGNISVIGEYVDYFKQYNSEITEGLITLLKSANEYDFFIDKELEEFEDHINTLENSEYIYSSDQEITYKQIFHIFRKAVFFQKYAIYCFRNKWYNKGVDNLLLSIKLSLKIGNNHSMINKTMSLFVVNWDNATEAQRVDYTELCRGVCENEKEGNVIFI